MTSTATLDTSVILEYWKGQNKAHIVKALLDLAQSSHVDLAITNRISSDIPQPPLSNRINELPVLGIQQIGSVVRIGVSKVGGEDRIGESAFSDVMQSIDADLQHEGVSNIPDTRDWDHLYGHYLHNRDVFLTWDDGILRIAPQLKSKLGVTVMKPEGFLGKVHEMGQTP